ncbi:MAG TPA: hypothetical protein DCS87_11735 [Rheinheimera sp.]|nr:hypothetical protein [Rheinheimera sp.]
MKGIIWLASLALIAGCASTSSDSSDSSGPWAASVKHDRFSGEVECFVSTGDFFTETSVVTSNNKYYPLIQIKNGVLMVGVRSGGRYPIPVGDVKIRVDSNKAYDISITETPVDEKVDPMIASMKASYESLPEDQKKLVISAIDNASKAQKAMVSTYTVATGDKAKALLEEIKNGRKLIYQAGIFSNMPAMQSSIGEVEINISLSKALKQCEI